MAVKRADTGRACERFLARLVDYLTEDRSAAQVRLDEPETSNPSQRRPTRAA